MISSTHLHAMLVHFPIALLIVGFLAELASFFFNKIFFRQASFYLLLLGTLGAIAAYLAGNAAGEGMDEGPLLIAMQLHQLAAIIALWLTIATAVLYLVFFFYKSQKKWIRIISVLLFAATITAIATTGYLGGQLVFKHGAGVQLELPIF